MDLMSAYKYCPRCAGQLAREIHFLQCLSCDLRVYNSPTPSTVLLLCNNKGEYMLVRRACDPKKGWWDTPGGFVEAGETSEEAIKREAMEELGIQLGDSEYFGSFYDTYNYQNVIFPTLNAVFISKATDDMVFRPADDVDGFKFFALDNIPLDQLAFSFQVIMFKSLQSANQ